MRHVFGRPGGKVNTPWRCVDAARPLWCWDENRHVPTRAPPPPAPLSSPRHTSPLTTKSIKEAGVGAGSHTGEASAGRGRYRAHCGGERRAVDPRRCCDAPAEASSRYPHLPAYVTPLTCCLPPTSQRDIIPLKSRKIVCKSFRLEYVRQTTPGAALRLGEKVGAPRVVASPPACWHTPTYVLVAFIAECLYPSDVWLRKGCVGQGGGGRAGAGAGGRARGRAGNGSRDKASYQAVSHRHQQCGAGKPKARGPQAVTNHKGRTHSPTSSGGEKRKSGWSDIETTSVSLAEESLGEDRDDQQPCNTYPHPHFPSPHPPAPCTPAPRPRDLARCRAGNVLRPVFCDQRRHFGRMDGVMQGRWGRDGGRGGQVKAGKGTPPRTPIDQAAVDVFWAPSVYRGREPMP
ncbi:hypothetical protein O3P69_003894 [Scylla paramamosain]|uniref:Uncharacterized protein n=1 Tax=Scylla paramamosain TaxID=85552 RepID=A0AAW0UGJ9_SCYPA